MVEIQMYLKSAVLSNCSDLFIVAGKPVTAKKNGKLFSVNNDRLDPEESEKLVRELYESAHRPMERLLQKGDDDFSTSIPGIARFRVNAYRQRGSLAAVIRVVNFGIPNWEEIGIPQEVMEISHLSSGLALVTGSAGSGRSTTLACIVDAINRERNAHIVTIEDPIEFLHRDEKAFITQRELAVDTEDYASALRSTLRQATDVIVLGDLDDQEIIQQAIRAAEAGNLVISTLHTMGAADTISHLVELFPPSRQPQIRVQLSKVLQTVVSQQLVPGKDGSLIPAFEVLWLDNATRSMVREDRIEQITATMQNFSLGKVVSMDTSILRLYKEERIDKETAIQFAADAGAIRRKLLLK